MAQSKPKTTRVANCQWSCSNPPIYRVWALKPDGTVRSPYDACGRHLTRAVEYVTVAGGTPGSNAKVTRL